MLSSNTTGASTEYQISRSLRFNSADSAYLNRTFSTPTNATVWTWSSWVKRSLGDNPCMFEARTSGSSGWRFSGNTILLTSAGTTLLTTTAVFRDPSAWYHVVISSSGSVITVYVNNVSYGTYSGTMALINTAMSHSIGRNDGGSSYFNGYLTEVNFIDGQALDPSYFGATNAYTGQWQPKAYSGSYGTNGFYLPFSDNSSVAALGYDLAPGKNLFSYSEQFDNAYWGKSNATITANATTAPDSTSTADKFIASATTSNHSIYSSSIPSGQTYTFSIYAKKAEYDRLILNYYGISFDLTNGIVESTLPWQYNASAAIASVGNGWYRCSVVTTAGGNLFISLASSAQTGNLSAPPSFTGNGTSGIYIWGAQLEIGGLTAYQQTVATSQQNNWTPNNFSVTAGAGNDSLIDVPTNWDDGGNGRGNYCTLNPLSSAGTLTNGNLDVSGSTKKSYATASAISGKWYAEFTVTGSDSFSWIGIATISNTAYQELVWQGGTGANSGGLPAVTWGNGDIISVGVDVDSLNVLFYKNNALIYTIPFSVAPSITSTNWVFAVFNSVSVTYTCNFGQRPFAYTPPSGFKALNTQNLPSPTISKADECFGIVLYTGNGSTQSVTGLAFTPDLVWIKSRSAATDHALYDVNRGVQSRLESNTTDAQVTSDGGLTAFNSGGFSLSTLAQVNTSAATYVAWNWKANGAGVTNTAGTITSTVSANATSGFSIVTYTGTGANATVGHGLGVAPSMVITKKRSAADGWVTWHTKLTSNAYVLSLQSTNAEASLPTVYNSMTTLNSTVFSIGTDSSTNTSSGTYVAYCFAAIPGYSAFGSYTGNGSADGPFVYTGFRPKFFLIKSTGVENWFLFDPSDQTYNPASKYLVANLTIAETVVTDYDFLSNGFKWRTPSTALNANGQTYIYAAFAESPFKFANAR